MESNEQPENVQQEPEVQPVAETSEPPKKRFSMKMIIIGVMVALLVIVALLYLFKPNVLLGFFKKSATPDLTGGVPLA